MYRTEDKPVGLGALLEACLGFTQDRPPVQNINLYFWFSKKTSKYSINFKSLEVASAGCGLSVMLNFTYTIAYDYQQS